MDRLDELESKSIYIIREAYAQCRKLALLWLIGKDSSTLLWLVRKAFYGKQPFPVLHIDTGRKFKEMIEFCDARAREFGLKLVVARNEEVLAGAQPGKPLIVVPRDGVRKILVRERASIAIFQIERGRQPQAASQSH